MQQALERISKSIRSYAAGDLSKTLAGIELVAAFKVVCKNVGVDVSELQTPVENYIDSVLVRVGEGGLAGC